MKMTRKEFRRNTTHTKRYGFNKSIKVELSTKKPYKCYAVVNGRLIDGRLYDWVDEDLFTELVVREYHRIKERRMRRNMYLKRVRLTRKVKRKRKR